MPVRSTNPRDRAREHARRDILLAAADVFARRGYAAATLAELAEAAGFAAPSLYRYFESKEEIVRCLVDLLLGELGATFEAPVDPGLPLAARLQALFTAQARLAGQHQHLIALLRLPDAGEALAAARRRLGGQHAGMTFYEQRMTVWLRRNARKAELRVAPDAAATALAGLAFAFLARPDGAATDAERGRVLVDVVLLGIAASTDGRHGA
jgi:AcrR family transcriptional regulator